MFSRSEVRPWELTVAGIFLILSGVFFTFTAFIFLGARGWVKYPGSLLAFLGIVNARGLLTGCKCARPVYLVLSVVNLVFVAALNVPSLIPYWLIIPGGITVLLFTPRVAAYFKYGEVKKREEERALRLGCD